MNEIKVRGARIHNLKNINLTIPKQKLIVITGVSGSGKSSLAFDILFEEGKNQYLRSIGILSGLDNQDRFDALEGIGPTVSVRQNTIRQSNPRSTLGTKTGILNQLALLYASDGSSHSHKRKLQPGSFLYTTVDGMCLDCQGKGSIYEINLKQLVPDQQTTLSELYEKLHITAGFLRLLKKRFGIYFSTPFWELPEQIRDEVIYGSYHNGKQSYCIERVLKNAYEHGEDVEKVYYETECTHCHGSRVNEQARKVLLGGKEIGELGQMTLTELRTFLESLLLQDSNGRTKDGTIVESEPLSQFGINVIQHILTQLDRLVHFRLGHLSLYRQMSTLSGGEIQRVFLHLHLESKLDSLIYVFDEPMAGLHPSEKSGIIEALQKLKRMGNTVIVVEHDDVMMREADQIIEIGPKAGAEGGEVIYQGSYTGYLKANTLLSSYVKDPDRLLIRRNDMNMNIQNQPVMSQEQSKLEEQSVRTACALETEALIIEHANVHYLKDLTVIFPLHRLIGVVGMSGSGKSSLIEDTLIKRLVTYRKYGRADGLYGAEQISGVVKISQDPIGRSSSSTPASYIGIWDKIRGLFAEQPQAVEQNMRAGDFSFHSSGACPDCSGSGYEKIYLTADFSVDRICPTCKGTRYREESLSVTYLNRTIADVLNLSIEDAITFFEEEKAIVKPLQILSDMGMGYLKLGQPTGTLSGGEAQRVKLAKELGHQQNGNILYVLDEPTTGLSLHDIALLLKLLDQLVKDGNSVIVIEHNISILKNCDYLIELGPEGGDHGGELIAQGTPKQLSENKDSKTGRYLV